MVGMSDAQLGGANGIGNGSYSHPEVRFSLRASLPASKFIVYRCQMMSTCPIKSIFFCKSIYLIIVIPEKIEQIELTPIFGSNLLFEPFWMGVYNLGPPDS
jgi:hypothetical protein